MDLSELVAPLNLSFNMALFCLGVFFRIDTTLAMVTAVSQSRIALTKKLSQLVNDEQKDDTIRRLNTTERQLMTYAHRLFVQRLTIWLALGGCMGVLTCAFFLFLCLYEPVLYFVVLVAFIISIIIMFAAGVCGYIEVGVTHKAELIMIEYLQDKELETYESDDDDDVQKKEENELLRIDKFDISSDSSDEEKLKKLRPRRREKTNFDDSLDKDKPELVIGK